MEKWDDIYKELSKEDKIKFSNLDALSYIKYILSLLTLWGIVLLLGAGLSELNKEISVLVILAIFSYMRHRERNKIRDIFKIEASK